MFNFLKDLTDEQIFYLISKEKATIIALCLEQIKEESKVTFLNRLETEKRKSVVREIEPYL